MGRLKKALIVGCLTASVSGLGGFPAASAESLDNPNTPSGNGVIKGEDQFNAAGELVGGSVLIPPGVVTNSEGNTLTVTRYVNVGGGTWDYGTSFNQGWSNYLHPHLYHGATTRQGKKEVRDDQPAGVWARTKLNRDIFGPTIHAYWRTS